MATKRKPLAERVTWHDSEYGTSDCWYGGEHIQLFAWGRGMWEVVWRRDQRKRFRKAGGLTVAKAEALRIVQAAIIAAAAEWED